MQVFKLSEKFLEQYKSVRPEWGPIGEVTYYRTYSRTKEDGTNEAWWETVARVVEGAFTIQRDHCERLKLPWKADKARRSMEKMYDKIFNFKFLPPGRGLWMMGTQFVYERGGMALNNCGFVGTGDLKYKGATPFAFMMDALMNGVGVGFDTMGAGTIRIRKPRGTEEYLIPDTREGWVEATRRMLDAYLQGKRYPTFGYSEIRPYGAPIKGFGGVASGPEPLMELHTSIDAFLRERVGNDIQSTDIVDLMNMIGKCVIAGNVRRSAEIALGLPEDAAYRTMKDPVLHEEELGSHRWASNNSILAEVGMDYAPVVDSITKNGEPGLIWLENIQQYGRVIDNGSGHKDMGARGVNPCGEQSLEPYELCCLVETFPSRHESFDEYKETLKYAYMYAKTVTLIPTHWPESNAVLMKNRRIGTSQSGIVDAFVKHGRRTVLDWSDAGYTYLRELDEIYSDWFCIPRSIKITSVKPSGTVSLLPGVSPGIHYPHSEYHIRRVRIADTSPLLPLLLGAGHHMEPDKRQKSTMVVDFPAHVEHFSRRKTDVTVWEQVVNAVDYQTYWCDNNVSITVTFKPEESIDVVRVLEAFEDRLKAISFLPLKDHGYEQAPYEEITKEQYESMTANLKPLDLSSLSIHASGDRHNYCDGDKCLVPGGENVQIETKTL